MIIILHRKIIIMGEEEYETLRKVAYVFLHSSNECEGIEDFANCKEAEYLEEHGV